MTAGREGLPGWSYADVLPYFRRSEDWEGGADTWRGAGGPLTVRKTTFEDPLCEAFLDAARDAQYPFTEDYNGENPDGFNLDAGNAAQWPAVERGRGLFAPRAETPQPDGKTKALVERIEFDGEQAIGIRYGQGGASVSAFAECEVILSGGTINSPQLLMLSGIGDPAHLRDHGIDVVMPLRGVGQNLADHTSSAFIFRRHDGGPFQRNMRFDRVVLSLARAYLGKGGFAADLPFGITGFLKTTPDVPAPDIQMLFWMGATTTASPWLPPFKKAFTDLFSVRIMPMHPTSRGHVALASSVRRTQRSSTRTFSERKKNGKPCVVVSGWRGNWSRRHG